MAKLKRFAMSPELLKQTLRLPEGSEIIRIDYDEKYYRGSWWFVVECEDFDDLHEGELIPQIKPIVHSIHEDRVISEHIEWEWNEDE